MKKLLFVLLAVAVAANANAQRRVTVSGVVADAETRDPIIGVGVTLAPAADSTATTELISGAGGAFSTGLAAGEYRVKTQLIGYQPLQKNITVGDRRTTLDTLFIRQGIEIEAVVKTAVALRTSLSGDTLIYNADSYKVAGDADVSALLEKMPGIKVENGAVQAQGEAVRKVLIDGREFFGEDVNAAITALPAEAVKSIEVFDKLSDNAEFTGIDDGEGYKAINITTRENMRQGVMGQVSGQYGAEPEDGDVKHLGLVAGNVSIFHDEAKITIGGTLNNLNERHFTTDDILGAGDNDGIARVGRFQFNYIDVWGKKDQWKFDASYTYGITDEKNDFTIDREYFLSDDARYLNLHSESNRKSINRNHSISARIDFKPNDRSELRIRPIFRYQGRNDDRSGLQTYIPVDGSGNIDLSSWSNSHETGWMAGLNANYRLKLGKPGRTISMFFNANYDPDDLTGESYSQRQDGTAIRQSTPSENYNYNIGGGLTYTEPVSTSSLVSLEYGVRYNYADNDRRSYLWDFTDEEYYSTPSSELSGVYNSGYLTHRAGPGYRLQRGGTTLSTGLFYEHATLESTRVLPVAAGLRSSFDNVTYAAMLDTKLGSDDTSLRMFLHSRTGNPSVENLQDVADISDVQNVRKGNPDLRPTYNHMLYTRLIIPNAEKGRTFALNLGLNYASNAISASTISESPGFAITDSEGNVVETLDAVGRYTTFNNMDGRWSGRLGLDYGFPLTFIKSNINLEAEISYGESPSQIGRWTPTAGTVWKNNYSRNMEAEFGVTLGSNISEKVDFRIGYELDYGRVRNTFSSRSNNDYLEHSIEGNFKFVFPLGFTFSGNGTWRYERSIEGMDYRQEYLIVSAGIGKKVFRSKLGEVSIFVNDIFNQNVDFRRQVDAQWVQNRTGSAIGRYVGVKFAWNIRSFGKRGSTNMELYNFEQAGSGHRGHRH